MFGIHYVASRDTDQPVDQETSRTTNLGDAILAARTKIRNTNVAVLRMPGAPLRPIGFLIYDAAGGQILHREYLG